MQTLDQILTIYTADSVFAVDDQQDFISYAEVEAIIDDYYSESDQNSWESVECIVSKDDF